MSHSTQGVETDLQAEFQEHSYLGHPTLAECILSVSLVLHVMKSKGKRKKKKSKGNKFNTQHGRSVWRGQRGLEEQRSGRLLALCPALFTMTGGCGEVADRNKTKEVTAGG